MTGKLVSMRTVFRGGWSGGWMLYPVLTHVEGRRFLEMHECREGPEGHGDWYFFCCDPFGNVVDGPMGLHTTERKAKALAEGVLSRRAEWANGWHVRCFTQEEMEDFVPFVYAAGNEEKALAELRKTGTVKRLECQEADRMRRNTRRKEAEMSEHPTVEEINRKFSEAADDGNVGGFFWEPGDRMPLQAAGEPRTAKAAERHQYVLLEESTENVGKIAVSMTSFADDLQADLFVMGMNMVAMRENTRKTYSWARADGMKTG